ncbi:enterobactin transporter EntS [Marinomonas rhizomae]|uniref:Multidrug efflux pump Tap n=1 Tax=Marinomonas rhizomae TaxID=491948 RepID=A0A366JH48_9GAMM|nr:enterobactin transporter EntS [Marinomonas rhizomae]RBP85769.1 ENTS family enterobactin (siderophore) exporter [Marinomonas rhizomae]
MSDTKKKSMLVDFNLLATHKNFRTVFIARTISILGLGMLSVSIPVQVYALTSDSLQVGIVMALEGIGLFIGLLLGGVLADMYERKRIILFARSTCGLGFLAMAINAWLPDPSLWAIYLLSIWDGFFGALGITALMACMPFLVGRENLMQARAISMVSVRLATVISPAIGGIIIAASDVAWNYLIAAIGTGITLLALLSLPNMRPKEVKAHNPLSSLWDGFAYIFTNKILAGVVIMGTLVTLTTAIRVLFPALADTVYGGGAWVVGLMYSAVPLGATLGAIVSGWANHVEKPGLAMMLSSLAAFLCLMGIGSTTFFPITLILLVGFGYLVSIASLLQYSFVQGHTPDHYLGRINGIWTAQDASGDSLGTLSIGLLGKLLSSLASVFVFGAVAMSIGLTLLACLKTLRNSPLNNPNLTEKIK